MDWKPGATPRHATDRPYAGFFVLDAGQGVAGPCCGMMLAATGADVVKLEPPEGDWSRGLSVRQGRESVLHAAWNRGIVLDLEVSAGRAAAKTLAARADGRAHGRGVAGLEHDRSKWIDRALEVVESRARNRIR